RHRLHAAQERTLEPKRRKGDDESHVAEPQEVRRPVGPPIERHQHRHEGGVWKLEPKGDTPLPRSWLQRASRSPHVIIDVGGFYGAWQGFSWREAPAAGA